jgi:hypothetical protein
LKLGLPSLAEIRNLLLSDARKADLVFGMREEHSSPCQGELEHGQDGGCCNNIAVDTPVQGKRKAPRGASYSSVVSFFSPLGLYPKSKLMVAELDFFNRKKQTCNSTGVQDNCK